MYKYNPTLIQRRILDHLEDITAGKINVVDPTNPFIFLLEASCVNTALSIQENEVTLRKQYSALSKTPEDLYLHMSDRDYLDRFSVPATVDFYFYLEVNSLLRSMIDVPSEGFAKLTIPPNTAITVDGLTFSLQYSIDIIKYYTGVVQVRYSVGSILPLQTISTNMIDYVVRADAQNVQWLVFSVPVQQFKITSTQFPVQSSSPFYETIAYDDNFYVARVYIQSGSGIWSEIPTTHTEQVYDPYKPTAVLTVKKGEVAVFIPPVYISNNLVSGTVRVDVYQTRGKLDINFSNYDLKAFSTKLIAVNEVADISSYTNAMQSVTYFSYTDKTISSGSIPLSFDQLRSAVINNSIGDRQLPITPTQIEYWINRRGFDLHKNVDVITNRLFVASKSIPRSKSRYPVTPISFTMETLVDNIDNLRRYSFTRSNEDRLTIPSYSTFELVNAKLMLLTDLERDHLDSIAQLDYIDEVNSRTLLVNPFHYVLDFNQDDNEDEFDLRAYSLDYPKADMLSFVYQNASLNLAVNTSSYTLEKKTFGYRLTVVTKSGNFYKKLSDAHVGVQLAFLPDKEQLYGYLNGTLLGTNKEGERIFQFDLLTNYDIDKHDQLYFTNFDITSNDKVNLPAKLSQNFVVLHYTNSLTNEYRASDSDLILGKFLLTPDHAVVTHEIVTLTFGNALHNLWRHYRSAAGDDIYERYTSDVPMYYEEDVYTLDPDTGLIYTLDDNCGMHFNLIHKKGDIVKNDQDETVYKHRKGDTILDENGKPVMYRRISAMHYVDIMLMDYKHYVADRTDYVAYLKDTIAVLNQWMTVDLELIDDSLLEQTRIYFKPKKSIGTVPVMVRDGVIQYINILQTIGVKYYVRNSTYKDSDIRSNIEYRTIEVLSEYLGTSRISKSDITATLKNMFPNSIDTVSITGIGGSYELDIAIVEEEGTTLALNKKLARQEDGRYIVNEDVVIEFIDIEAN